MENDLNKDQVVTDPDLTAGAVAQQDLDTQVVTEDKDDLLADGTKKADKTVKYSEFEKANEAKKVAEEQTAYAQRQLEIVQQQQSQVQQTQQNQPGSTYELAMQQLGFTADDLYDGNNVLKIQNRKAELDNMMQQQQTAAIAQQQFIASHSDFGTVVGSVNPSTGVIMTWSQEAQALKMKKPYLAASFQTAEGAYHAVMDERNLVDLEKKAAVNQEHLNRQGVDLNTAPLGGSAAGGGGAGDPMSQSLLSREATQDIINKLANGEQV
jgi:hypothetical protein